MINDRYNKPQIICWRGMANNDYIYMGAGSITPRQLIIFLVIFETTFTFFSDIAINSEFSKNG
jgi:hypothetical protein